MTFTDPIGDMFSRIRNGQMRSLSSIEIPSSKFRKNILEILKNEGYIKDYFIENNTETPFRGWVSQTTMRSTFCQSLTSSPTMG